MATDARAAGDKIYTVSEITGLVKFHLEGVFPKLWIEGEVSNFRCAQSGHMYFTLKDERSQIKAVMFRGDNRNLKFELKNGLSILGHGRITVYEPFGEYQFVLDKAEPKGKGALQLAFEQLKEKLRAEGLFDEARKKKLPLLPKTVGLVTSPRGAAVVDIIRTLRRRFAPLHILLYPVKVQGEGAAREIAGAVDYFSSRTDVDVLIVGRGGGSIEDLWAFNEEIVARAIARCAVPVISAVGHEVDFTIADFVADVRASTPSVAAEMVIDKEESFRERIGNLSELLSRNFKLDLRGRSERVFRLTHHRAFRGFKDMILGLEQRVDDLESRALEFVRRRQRSLLEARSRLDLASARARNAVLSFLRERRGRWEKLSVALDAASPLSILKKGYTLCWRDGGRVLVRRPAEVRPGEEVAVSFFRGELACRVESVDAGRSIESRFEKE